MKKKTIKYLPFALLLIGILGFVGLLVSKRNPQMAPTAAETAVVETASMHAKSGSIRILGDGFVRPRAEIWVTPQVSGRVIEVNPNLISGGHLKAGEKLLQIDPAPFKADLDQAVANHQAAKANQDYLEKQYERSKTLVKRKDISQAQLDDTYSKLQQVKADVRRFEALIERRRYDLQQTSIMLPFDARVVEEKVDIGDAVTVGQQLAHVYETGKAEITVSLTEKDAALIPELWSLKANGKHSDALVTAKFGGGTYEWDAYLDRVNAGLNRDTRTVDVVVAVPDPEVPGRPVDEVAKAQDAPPLLIGTYADVSLTGRHLDRYYEVPTQAVREGPAIWVATQEGTLSIIPVKPVREANNVAIVTADRNLDGEKLIVSNLDVALPNMPLLVADGEASQ